MSTQSQHTIAMSGASGFVGTSLKAAFQDRGWDAVSLGRKELHQPSEDLAATMQDADVIVNLAGAPVINRWTSAYKREMYDSRIEVTKKLVQACSLMDSCPAVFISASAVGYYAPGGPYTEESDAQADDFLGTMAGDWEQEALKAQNLGMRTVIFRFGIVLGSGGGALKQMITPFKLGVGGRIGNGTQPFSWIHMTDLRKAYEYAIEDSAYEGIYNLTSPGATTNNGLTEALGRALHRPTMIPVPAFVLRMQFGEGAEVLTSGQEVIPQRLLDKKFPFQFTDIDSAIEDCLS